ncbi:MAG: hypothetical protein ACUVTD_07120 [Nitrososphaerales archaeon]
MEAKADRFRMIVFDPSEEELVVKPPRPYPAYLDSPVSAYLIGLILSNGYIEWKGRGVISGYKGHIPIWKEVLAKVMPYTSVSKKIKKDNGAWACWCNITLARTIIRNPKGELNWVKMHPIIYKFPEIYAPVGVV